LKPGFTPTLKRKNEQQITFTDHKPQQKKRNQQKTQNNKNNPTLKSDNNNNGEITRLRLRNDS